MFVCVFAQKFPALASQPCCEVSRPRTVGEYEDSLLLNFIGTSTQAHLLVMSLNGLYNYAQFFNSH